MEARCPVCGLGDRVQRISGIVAAGTAAGPAGPTRLAEALGFPRRRRSRRSLRLGIGLLVLGGPFLLLGGAVGVRTAVAFGGPVCILGILLLVAGLTPRGLPERARPVWNELYYCHRDDVCFHPATGERFPPAGLTDFLRKAAGERPEDPERPELPAALVRWSIAGAVIVVLAGVYHAIGDVPVPPVVVWLVAGLSWALCAGADILLIRTDGVDYRIVPDRLPGSFAQAWSMGRARAGAGEAGGGRALPAVLGALRLVVITLWYVVMWTVNVIMGVVAGVVDAAMSSGEPMPPLGRRRRRGVGCLPVLIATVLVGALVYIVGMYAVVLAVGAVMYGYAALVGLAGVWLLAGFAAVRVTGAARVLAARRAGGAAGPGAER